MAPSANNCGTYFIRSEIMIMKRVNFFELEEVQDDYGMWIIVDEKNKPFTGIVIESYDDGQLSYEAVHVNGKVCGYEKRWHENGQISNYEQKYNNSSHGISKAWDRNGLLIFDAEFKFGNIMCYKRYNMDGSLKDSYHIKEDKEKLNSFNTLVKRIEAADLTDSWNSIFKYKADFD